MEAAAAILISTAVSTGASIYQSEEQKKAAKDAQDRAEQQRAIEEAKARQIALDTRPEAMSATGIQFGTSEDSSSTSEFLVQRPLNMRGSSVNTVNLAGLGTVL